MKVLFAVSNENISTQIVKEYQKKYKEIISYKNMYYFNAIVKELQRDKSYDRIVIDEELEPFANNNYDAIDKFLFEKLDSISDEASGINGEDIPIILIGSERRSKSEPILVKLFGIGIYNMLLGQDRKVEMICALLNKPRGKKEAKLYYKIESDEVNYRSESEENVSEAEIKNILNHYKRLGKDEDRYVESFNNIAAQYNDAQLRIITKFLPLNVKAVLEEKSQKYQSVMTFGDTASTLNAMKKQKQADGLKIGFLNNGTQRPNKPIIVPTAVKKVAIKKTIKQPSTTQTVKKDIAEEKFTTPQTSDDTMFQSVATTNPVLDTFTSLDPLTEPTEEPTTEFIPEPVKKGRGRPRKITTENDSLKTDSVKRGRGRPRKIVENSEEENILPGFDDVDATLPGFEDVATTLPGLDETNSVQPGFEENSFNNQEEKEVAIPGLDDITDNQEETVLPGFEDIESQETTLPGFDVPDISSEIDALLQSKPEQEKVENQSVTNFQSQTSPLSNNNVSGLLSRDKKVVAFVGTTKNGTSFLVNNLGKCLSSMGIKTAILDLTMNRNSYYIYTKNEEKLRNIAYESIKKLRSGICEGINVDKYLDVFTALPGDKLPLEDADNIVGTLAQNYSVVLMDTDFNTPVEYFGIAQEIYIVQTMDILTIQPMTAFMRDLKAKDVLKPEKIRIIINKEMRVRGLTAKVIIGGLAFYNDPAMSFMTELFDKDNVKYCTIPFEEEVCSRYLEGVMDCEISINGYSKNFNMKLKELANMVYPLLNGKYKPMGDYAGNNKFSSDMNNTLEQMRNKY